MAILSFLSMYGLMYMMVDRLDHVFTSVNQLYMAGLMTAPMIVLELALMGAIYPDKRTNAILMGTSVVAGIAFIVGIRTQVAVDDEQLLRSMISHHSGAILMCEEASLEDPELLDLCEFIIESQRNEIEVMQAKLRQR